MRRIIAELKAAGIRVSLFVEPDPAVIEASAAAEADIVELHTGRYCDLALAGDAIGVAREVGRIAKAATLAHSAGLEVHAGHGLTYNTVTAVARMPEMAELNIGHFLVGEAIFGGLNQSVAHMRRLMDEARAVVGRHETAGRAASAPADANRTPARTGAARQHSKTP